MNVPNPLKKLKKRRKPARSWVQWEKLAWNKKLKNDRTRACSLNTKETSLYTLIFISYLYAFHNKRHESSFDMTEAQNFLTDMSIINKRVQNNGSFSICSVYSM